MCIRDSLGFESTNLILTIDNKTHRDGLHAARGKSAADFLRQKRAELVADKTIQNTASLLRVDQILILSLIHI